MISARELAYMAIDEERGYQIRRWKEDENQHFHSTVEFLVFIREYANNALGAYTYLEDDKVKVKNLHSIRKIAAMAVACMEQNGTVTRAQEEADEALDRLRFEAISRGETPPTSLPVSEG